MEDDPAIELGTGDLEFVAIENGDTVQVVFGPQGGYHLLGSLRVRSLDAGNPDDLNDPSNPTAQFEVRLDGTNLVKSEPFTQGLDPIADCAEGWSHEQVGRFAVVEIEDDDELAGETVEFSVHIMTSTGLSLRDAREVEIEPHPLNF